MKKMEKWKKIYSSSEKIVWLNYITNETKICYLTYKDGTPLPKGWKRWFSNTYQLFYYTYNDNNGHKQIKWETPNKSNQYDYSPKIEPLTVIDLDSVLNYANKILEIEDKDKDIYVILIYKGYPIPCTINKISDTETEIKIKGEKEDVCLEFSININDNKKTRTAYIGLISITNNECPPKEIEKKGAFLLSMVDEICRQLKINILKLSDGSYLTCKKNREEVSLAFLSLMK